MRETLPVGMLLVTVAWSCGCGGDDTTPATGGSGGSGAAVATGGNGASGGAGAGASGGSGAAGGGAGAAGGSPSGCTPRASGWITDDGDYPEPAPPSLPAAGASVADPNFGATVVRLSDEADGEHCTVAYSYWQTFNLDSTLGFIDCSTGSMLFDFDPASAQASSKRPLFATQTPDGTTPNWEDAIWSDLAPTVLFAHDTTRLWRYDVASETYTLVKDFSALTGGGHVRQMSKSRDDDVFGFSTQNASWDVTGALAYRASTDQTLVQLSEPGIDEAQVDKSGQWLVVKTGNQGAGVIEVEVVDLQSEAVEQLIDDGPDYAPGHSDNGTDIVIGADNWRNQVTFRELATPHQHSTVLDLGDDWTLGLHVSMRAQDESWALISLYEGGAHTPGLYHNEIIQVAADGSAQVRRLAHHHSLISDYWDMPRANISRDGCFVAFTSNWGGGRRDVYVVDLSE